MDGAPQRSAIDAVRSASAAGTGEKRMSLDSMYAALVPNTP